MNNALESIPEYDFPAPYLELFEQEGGGGGGVLIYFLLFLGDRDDTYKSVIVTLSDLWGGNCPLPSPPPPPPLGTALLSFRMKVQPSDNIRNQTWRIEYTYLIIALS